MNFLGIDTSGKYLSVIAFREGADPVFCFRPDCAVQHSVDLMDAIGETLSRALLNVRECDFFAVVTGPGSFTGIRIGISTAKGLCAACGKPALCVTSFDALAYAEGKKQVLALVDAGHGMYYACGYGEDKRVKIPPVFCSEERAARMAAEGFCPLSFARTSLCGGGADVCGGFFRAVHEGGRDVIPARELTAVYLRKSSAEEGRK